MCHFPFPRKSNFCKSRRLQSGVFREQIAIAGLQMGLIKEPPRKVVLAFVIIRRSLNGTILKYVNHKEDCVKKAVNEKAFSKKAGAEEDCTEESSITQSFAG